MKSLLITLFFVFHCHSAGLDFSKTYSILTDRCTQCGNESPDVNVLDLSDMDLEDINEMAGRGVPPKKWQIRRTYRIFIISWFEKRIMLPNLKMWKTCISN